MVNLKIQGPPGFLGEKAPLFLAVRTRHLCPLFQAAWSSRSKIGLGCNCATSPAERSENPLRWDRLCLGTLIDHDSHKKMVSLGSRFEVLDRGIDAVLQYWF